MLTTERFLMGVKKNILFIATVLISGGVLLYFLFRSNGIEALADLLTRIRPGWLAVAIAASLAGFGLEGWTLHLLCKRLYPEWRFSRSFCVGMTGLLYSAITPFATGGQPMQIYSMKRMGMGMGKAGSVIAVKTLSYQVVMVVYSMILVVCKLGFFQNNVSNFSFVTVIGLATNSAFILLVFLFLLSKSTTDRILRFILRMLYRLRLCRHPVRRYEGIHRQLELFHNSAKIMGKCWRLYANVAVFTVLQITLNGLIPYFIYRSFHLGEEPAPVFTMVAAQAFVSMVSAFVPLPGASGGAEGSFYLFFGMFFGSAILPGILLWRTITYYSNILFGCIFTFLGKRMYCDP